MILPITKSIRGVVENQPVKVILRICAGLGIISLTLLSVLFVLGLVPSELFKDVAMKLIAVGAIITASLLALSLVLRK